MHVGVWISELGYAGRCMEKAWARLGECAGARVQVSEQGHLDKA